MAVGEIAVFHPSTLEQRPLRTTLESCVPRSEGRVIRNSNFLLLRVRVEVLELQLTDVVGIMSSSSSSSSSRLRQTFDCWTDLSSSLCHATRRPLPASLYHFWKALHAASLVLYHSALLDYGNTTCSHGKKKENIDMGV
jgi:hypothetical protein